MKLIGWCCLLALFIGCQGAKQDNAEMKTKKDSVSYSIGMDIGKNFKAQSIDIEPSILLAGINDAMNDGKTKLTEQQSTIVMNRFREELMAKEEEKKKVIGDKNLKEGEAFLTENKKKDGVVTTASGLQYKIVRQGTGPKPSATQTVTVHFRGTLIDGTEFYSTIKRGQPETFQITGVMKGWTEALQLMPVGSQWTLYIPPNLAYGERGSGGVIGANATLVFEVELMSAK